VLLYAQTCLFASSCATGSCGLWLFHRRIQQGRTLGKTILIDDGVIRSFLHRKSVEFGSIKSDVIAIAGDACAELRGPIGRAGNPKETQKVAAL
jgi:hypothetical protein